MFQIAEAQSAPLLLDRDAVQAQRAHLGPQFDRETVVAVDLGGQRLDPVAREAAGGVADHVGRLTQLEIERRNDVGVGGHGRLSCPLSIVAGRRRWQGL